MQNGTSTRPKHGRRAQTLLLAAVFAGITAEAQTPITTAQFNNARTGANLTESTLNTSNVNVSSFGKLRTFSVDGYVYAQPLYVPNLSIGGSSHNVLYVATMTNHLYAFDADTGAQLFEVTPETLGAPVAASSPCPDIDITGPELGVLSTPVIDLATNSLYVVSATPNTGAAGYTHRLFKLDITTGQPKLPPVTIAPTFPGTGTDSRNGYISMNQTSYIQRPGLLLSAGNVYAAFGSCGPDPSPYHGWVVGHSAATLEPTATFNTSPNGDEAAIWQSGRGLVGDSAGKIYALTGNGTFNGSTDFGDSFIKLWPNGPIQDWFVAPNRSMLEEFDLDPSSSGPVLTPDSNLLIGGGKDGIVYVLNPANLGHDGGPLQKFQATRFCDNPALIAATRSIRMLI